MSEWLEACILERIDIDLKRSACLLYPVIAGSADGGTNLMYPTESCAASLEKSMRPFAITAGSDSGVPPDTPNVSSDLIDTWVKMFGEIKDSE